MKFSTGDTECIKISTKPNMQITFISLYYMCIGGVGKAVVHLNYFSTKICLWVGWSNLGQEV